MKSIHLMLGTIAAVMLSGCFLKAPLAPPSGIKMDRSLLGTWEIYKDHAGNPPTQSMTLHITEVSETEYEARVDSGGIQNIMKFKAYMVELGGMSCLQLKLIHMHEEMQKEPEVRKSLQMPYMHYNYRFSGGVLSFHMFEPEGIEVTRLKTTADVQQAFLNKIKNGEDPFVKEGPSFKKVR